MEGVGKVALLVFSSLGTAPQIDHGRRGYRTPPHCHSATLHGHRIARGRAILSTFGLWLCVQVWICRATRPWNPSSGRRHSCCPESQTGNLGVWDPSRDTTPPDSFRAPWPDKTRSDSTVVR